MNDENVQQEKPTPPPLRELRDGVAPKRRGRPPKVRMAEGVVKAEDATITGPSMSVTIDGAKIAEALRKQAERGEQKIELVKDEPLLSLHLRRVKNELTDTTGKVHIPASVLIHDGAKVVAHFYRDE